MIDFKAIDDILHLTNSKPEQLLKWFEYVCENFESGKMACDIKKYLDKYILLTNIEAIFIKDEISLNELGIENRRYTRDGLSNKKEIEKINNEIKDFQNNIERSRKNLKKIKPKIINDNHVIVPSYNGCTLEDLYFHATFSRENYNKLIKQFKNYYKLEEK